ISIEVIDARCLFPFDKAGVCAPSLQKTNRPLVVEGDLPGCASAYIMQNILEDIKGYFLLDIPPRTLSALALRPFSGSYVDYFTKASVDYVVEAVYQIMTDVNPQQFPNYL